MTRCYRALLLLLGLLLAYGVLAVECRHRQREDAAAAAAAAAMTTTTTTTTTEARHRHRHRHESSSRGNHRGHHEAGIGRRSWQHVDEYEYDGDSDDEPSDEDDSYYEASYSYDRPRSSHHHRAAQRSNWRMLESRYPRYHPGGYHPGWYDENSDRRGIPSRYDGTRYHRYHGVRMSHRHRPAYARDREDAQGDFDHERLHRYGSDEMDKRRDWWRNTRRRAYLRRDWRNKMSAGYSRGARRHRLLDDKQHAEGVVDRGGVPARWWPDDWWRRRADSNSSSESSSRQRFAKKPGGGDDEDYEDRGGLEDDDKEDDEDEDEVWKDIEESDGNADEQEQDDEEEELDNDFYKSQAKPLLRTYDDIIRRLTSDDSTTARTTVKRDYRNTEQASRHGKREGYINRNAKLLEPRNASKSADPSSALATTSGNYFAASRRQDNSTVKSVGRKPPRTGVTAKDDDRQRHKTTARMADSQPKTKNLEQDYDEYLNGGPDNEKEDDLAKAGVDDDSGMQADVTNADYPDSDDNGDDDDEAAAFTTRSTTTMSTTRTTTTTTTTTTSTPQPSLSGQQQRYDYRDPRAYDSGTAAQYNGYQGKNEYPPMSAHSVHKWQSLGTREGVKETRSNMQQYNKNGKSAEIREALQHAIKVNKEGSCQWPRARVIPVRDVYPSPSTTYIPHCAILHRCSDDTGCCRSEALTCVPKYSHRVELSFYTTNVGGSSVVEKLSFYNHTECECRERSEYDTTNEKSADQRVSRHYQSSSPPQNMKKPPPRKPCRCPSYFTPKITSDGACQCNCHEGNDDCVKTRRGKVYFSLADRICIQNNECSTPNCEFGEYIRWQGKCPRKRDTFDAIAGYRTNLNHRFRS